MPDLESADNESATAYAKRAKTNAKQQAQVKISQKWEEKSLHGKYPTRVKEADIDCNLQLSHKWLKSAGLKAETEGLLVATRDQSLATRSYQVHRILNKDVSPMCQVCNCYEETINHIISLS